MKDEYKASSQGEKPKRFRISRRLYIVLICFFIATVFWLLLALSRDYPATVTFPIVYTNLPGRKVIVNDLPDSISLQIKATGFRILAYNFIKTRKPLEIDVLSRLKSGRMMQNEVLAVPTRVFSADFARQFGPEISVFGYQPDSIVFYFSDLITRKVPVHLNMNIQFDKQYDYSDDISLSPDSIEVSGPPSIVNSLTQVETEEIQLSGVKANVIKNVGVKTNKLLSFNIDKIDVNVPVEKFTEGTMSVRIEAINVQTGYSLKTFPDKVNIRYMVALSKYNDVKDQMFEVVVNGEMLSAMHPEKLKVELVKNPSFVRGVILEPEGVDYILRKQ